MNIYLYSNELVLKYELKCSIIQNFSASYFKECFGPSLYFGHDLILIHYFTCMIKTHQKDTGTVTHYTLEILYCNNIFKHFVHS